MRPARVQRMLPPASTGAVWGGGQFACSLASDPSTYPHPCHETLVLPSWLQRCRLIANAVKTYEFTSEFFFDEALTTTVHAASPYNTCGQRSTINTTMAFTRASRPRRRQRLR